MIPITQLIAFIVIIILQRSILEADQEEENEEAGDMNDEEINEIIARSDNEAALFREIDVKRERDTEAAWKAAGHRGKPPLPLIQLEELPDCYRTDEPFENKDELDEMEGRGHRRRTVVNYNDGLSDDQWALALEEGEDIQELAERARERKERRATNKLARDIEINDPPTPDAEPSSSSRGRKGKKGKGKMVVDQSIDLSAASGKRKRGMKSMSVTPSINNDEDDEDRDAVRILHCGTGRVLCLRFCFFASQKRRKVKVADVPAAVREKMKKAFNECYKAVLNCETEEGRKRCELFKELPDKKVCRVRCTCARHMHLYPASPLGIPRLLSAHPTANRAFHSPKTDEQQSLQDRVRLPRGL